MHFGALGYKLTGGNFFHQKYSTGTLTAIECTSLRTHMQALSRHLPTKTQ